MDAFRLVCSGMTQPDPVHGRMSPTVTVVVFRNKLLLSSFFHSQQLRLRVTYIFRYSVIHISVSPN